MLLGKYSVITGGTIDEADGVIEFFLKQQQEDFVKLPEAENIGKTSREAETKTEELEKTLRMVVLTPRPIGSCLTCL